MTGWKDVERVISALSLTPNGTIKTLERAVCVCPVSGTALYWLYLVCAHDNKWADKTTGAATAKEISVASLWSARFGWSECVRSARVQSTWCGECTSTGPNFNSNAKKRWKNTNIYRLRMATNMTWCAAASSTQHVRTNTDVHLSRAHDGRMFTHIIVLAIKCVWYYSYKLFLLRGRVQGRHVGSTMSTYSIRWAPTEVCVLCVLFESLNESGRKMSPQYHRFSTSVASSFPARLEYHVVSKFNHISRERYDPRNCSHFIIIYHFDRTLYAVRRGGEGECKGRERKRQRGVESLTLCQIFFILKFTALAFT